MIVSGEYKLVKGEDLKKVPSCDIFGYIIASAGYTNANTEMEVVEKLFQMKKIVSPSLVPYIMTILENIIGYGDIDDYMGHLTENANEFITAEGEIVKTADLSWI